MGKTFITASSQTSSKHCFVGAVDRFRSDKYK